MVKHLTKIADLTPQIVEEILVKAFDYKTKRHLGIRTENILNGKVIAMIFEKPSLRTKVAFEVATTELGGVPVFLTSGQILASGNKEQGRESIPDIARNLERFTDLILARVYSHTVIQEIAENIQKPVINALCDQHHPTQALADIMAIRWHKGKTKKLKVVFIGDGNNVATSLMQICAMMGLNFAIASPHGYEIPQKEIIFAQKWATKNNSTLTYATDPQEVIPNADVVYTDTFVSMGQEDEKQKRVAAFKKYQINMALLKQAKKDAIFMHCLPAHRGEEVTDEVMDSKQSIVFDEAECRLHIAKALLSTYL